MSILDDIYCHFCERFITKEQWHKHFFSSKHLHREVNGYWPVYFPQRKLIKDGKIKIERALWKMFFATGEIEEVEEF